MSTISVTGSTTVTTSTTSTYIVENGGTLTVSSGGNVTDAFVQSGGKLVVKGGVEAGATISAGGAETVSSGSASDDLIFGTLSTTSGDTGVFTSETVENGGTFNLLNGNSAASTTVLSGGVFFLSGNNGAVTSTVLSGGGTLELASPKANISGTLTFEGGDNTLDIVSSASSGYGDLAVISGFSSTDDIDVTALGAGGTLTFTTSTISGVTDEIATYGGESFIFSGTTTYTSSTLAVVSSGGHEYIEYSASGFSSGGVTTSVATSTASGAYTETSGNTLLVVGGGSVSAATIDKGGFLVVSGGVDAAATISSGGTETVSAGSATGDQIYGSATVDGGAVTSETVEGGGALTFNGGTGSATTVSSGGTELVSAGSASGDQIYGVLSTVSGGTAAFTSETVKNGGVFDLLNGNSAAATTVLSGGLLLISGANGATTGTVLSGGGTLELDSPKAAISGSLTFEGGNNTLDIAAVASSGYGDLATISGFSSTDKIDVTVFGAGASLTVTAGSSTTSATVTSGASSETFIFSGTTTYTSSTLALVANGGQEYVEYNSAGWPTGTISTLSAGSYSGLTVSSLETLIVPDGASVVSTTVQSGGDLAISGGADSAATISAGGAETVSAGSASGDQIYGAVTVDAGATITNDTVLSSGSLAISGGADSAATISAGGAETVSAGSASGDQIFGAVTVVGGTVTSETVSSGGSLVVDGGADYAATISAGGSETVSAGSATGDQIHGSASVSSGAMVTSETVQSGGTLTLSAGAVDSATTVLSGGTELALAGSATGDQIYGVISTLSGGSASFANETVENGGVLDLFNGNSASGTTVLSGGELFVSGKNGALTDTVLSGGGTLVLASPKAAVSGSLTFEGGGNTLELTDISSAGYGVLATISGYSSTDKIDITSAAYPGSSLTLSQSVSGGDTVAQVMSAGTVVETFTFADPTLYGSLSLQSDGNGGVDLEITAFNVTTSVTTSTASGVYTETPTNTLLVLSGGSVSAATIDAGAFLVVDGGVDAAATILSGGTETISAGTATGDQIYGSAIVSGGTVSGETVLSGGQLIVGDPSVSNVVLSGGGLVDLAASTATLSGSLTFANGGNKLEVSAIANSGDGDQAVISGFSTADKIDVTGISPTGASLTFAPGANGTEIATVSGVGGSESFIFANGTAYSSSTMSLTPDGSGGVDLILDTKPVVTFTSLSGLETNQATDIVNGTVDVAVDPEAVGTTVDVYEGNTVVGTGTVGANGYWSANVTFLNDGGVNSGYASNVLTASDTDGAGNAGSTGQSLTYNVNTTAAAFTPGNLVISISGDGDGSGSYGDNQAGPITLEQITTTGTIVSQLVLPQTTTVNANGVTEYAISGEYGSSSEGSLELSADGHSLTIAGYGVNAQAFNQGGAAVYGTAALAQSTSIQGGQYTAVARVIADINANGVVDTSTALYNVFNTNNPRSVVTVNGSSFYISGQGVKGDTTQGVFYALDGASSATAINTATDTRTAEIYDGQLYVSADSTQGATNISDYGALPTSATTPTVLNGLNTSVALTAATANTVNTADIGQSVYLSPESFFFANADTLYVADGGDPKNGGLGDGGLQKWVDVNGTWTLEYTLSAGLNLVPDTASSGTSGLIGLTGEVNSNGTVTLYATNETLTDLGQTYVYGITDSLSSTTGAGESFTEVMAASPGENIRGISFAPTPYAPTITGTVAGQTTTSEAAIKPFSSVTIGDANNGGTDTDTLTITIGGVGGALTGGGLSGSNGSYTLTGTAAAITSELDALSFTPTAGAPNTTSTSTFTLSDLSSAYGTATVNTTTTVIDSDLATSSVVLNIATAVADELAGIVIHVPPGDTVTVADTAANIALITQKQANALKAAGYTSIASTNGAVTLSTATALILLGDSLTVTGAPVTVVGTAAAILALTSSTAKSLTSEGYTLGVLDTAANIETLTAAEIASLSSLHVTKISASDTSVALNVMQTVALEAAKILVVPPTGFEVSLSDTAAHLEALTVGQIEGLAAIGFSGVTSTNASVVFKVAQALAFEAINIKLTVPSGDKVTISDTAAHVAALTAAQIAALPAAGVSGIAATGGGVTLSVALALALEGDNIKLTVPSGDKVTISDTAANIAALRAAQIAALPAAGVSGIVATGGGVTLSVAQAIALETAMVTLAVPSGDQVTISDTAARLEALTAAQISALPALGVDELYSTNANVSYTAAQTSAIVSSGLKVAATGSDTVTEKFANGGYEVFANGVLTQTKTVNADGSYDISYTNVTGQSYSSYENIYNTAGTRVAEAFNNTNGTGSLTLYGNGLTVTSSSTQESVTTGADTFALTEHSTETITASGTKGDTFVFTPSFGQDAITGFAATGASHDVLQFSISDFSYLTPAMTQAQDLAAVLAHATQTAAGNTVITDTLGDALTLNAVTKATLTANAADFVFK